MNIFRSGIDIRCDISSIYEKISSEMMGIDCNNSKNHDLSHGFVKSSPPEIVIFEKANKIIFGTAYLKSFAYKRFQFWWGRIRRNTIFHHLLAHGSLTLAVFHCP